MEDKSRQERLAALTVGVLHCNRLATEAMDTIDRLISRYREYLDAFSGQRGLQSRVGMAMRTLKGAANQLDSLRPRIYMIEQTESGAGEDGVFARRPVMKSMKFGSGQKVTSKDLK